MIQAMGLNILSSADFIRSTRGFHTLNKGWSSFFHFIRSTVKPNCLQAMGQVISTAVHPSTLSHFSPR
jgi:hypothetical protein